jgi:hypothetical protein
VVAVVEPQEELFGAVFRDLMADDLAREESELGVEPVAERLRDVVPCISPKEPTRLPKTQRRIWSARKGRSPADSTQAASSSRERLRSGRRSSVIVDQKRKPTG